MPDVVALPTPPMRVGIAASQFFAVNLFILKDNIYLIWYENPVQAKLPSGTHVQKSS